MEVIPVHVDADIAPSDDLTGIIASSAEMRDGDIVVVSQKAVSKQEGRMVDLSLVKPSALAVGIASQYGKDPRIVELVLSESARIVRMRSGVIIVETHSGVVCANAGVDESNVKRGHATLLPSDPDASACRMRLELLKITKLDIPVIISDTFGRPFRMGQTDCAIGVSGLNPISNYAGVRDAFGRELRVTAIAVADEIASAAELAMEKTGKCPAAIVRGCGASHVRVRGAPDPEHGRAVQGARALLRPRPDDLFL